MGYRDLVNRRAVDFRGQDPAMTVGNNVLLAENLQVSRGSLN
jgi:hypothetical protein